MKLIAIGCTYTDDKMFIKDPNILYDIEEQLGYPVWPSILSKELKMDVVNLGKVGASNKYIFDQVLGLEDIDDIGLVVCLWSGWAREDGSTEDTLRYMSESQKYIRDNKWPYIFIQGIHPYDYSKEYPRTAEIKKLLDSPYFDELEKDNFEGWPIFTEIGGWCADDKLTVNDKTNSDLMGWHKYLSNDPNTNGHKKISEMVLKKYKKLYYGKE
jgi:hypothetical protein